MSKGVLIFGNYPPPFGGVPGVIHTLVPALVDAGYHVHVVSSGRTGIEKHPGWTLYKQSPWLRLPRTISSARKNLQAWRNNFPTFGADSFRQLYGYLSRVSLGRAILRKHPISVIKAFNLSTGAPAAAVLSAEYDIPMVVTNLGEYYSDPDFFRKHRPLVEFIFKQAARKLSITCHCGAIYKKLAADYELPLDSTYDLVHVGVDLVAFNPQNSANECRDKLGIGRSEKVILYMARMTREMGLGVFLQAATKMISQDPTVRILICGHPMELYGEALAFESQHRGRVTVVPNVPFADQPLYYAAADVVAVPTLGARACGSLSAAEAAASGRPVVASRVGGVPEFVVDGESGLLIPPNEPDALAQGLLRIVGDQALARKMGLAGREFVEDEFDAQDTNSGIVRVLDEVCLTTRQGARRCSPNLEADIRRT